MPKIYNQAIACRFGVELADQLRNVNWTHIDIAVAWVRRSGIRHILPALAVFLERGGVARFAVGIDIENTSKEGLEDLLSLAGTGNIQTFLHHNEHPRVTFHPKVYLFRNDEQARLIVGSNNLTESGLYTNTELALQVDAAFSDSAIVAIRSAFDSWCDLSERLAHPLDAAFLIALEQGGYIRTEEALNRRRASNRLPDGGCATPGQPPLFGSKGAYAPPRLVVQPRL